MEELLGKWQAFWTNSGPDDVQKTRDVLSTIRRNIEANVIDKSNPQAATALARSAMGAIAPLSPAWLVGRHGGDDEQIEDESTGYNKATSRCQATVEVGLAIVAHLQQSYSESGQDWLGEDASRTLMALGAAGNPWTTREGAEKANAILLQGVERRRAAESALPYLRRIFERSKPAGVTASGRPAAYEDDADTERRLPDESAKMKPWKYGDYRAVSVLSWVMDGDDNEPQDDFMRDNCRSLVPPLLTLGEDSSTLIRTQGIALISRWIATTPASVARPSGLLQVFEERVLVPSLGYLPSLTPEPASVLIVSAAHDALLTLCQKVPDAERMRVADKIFRAGVMAPYIHVAGRYYRLMQVLVEKTERLVLVLGVYAVKYLKDLVPMLSNVVKDVTELLGGHDDLLCAALSALHVTLRECRVRIVVTEAYVEEIIKMICLAWLYVMDSGVGEMVVADPGAGGASKGTKEWARDRLRVIASSLFAFASQKGIDLYPRVEKLVEAEARFGILFPRRILEDGELEYGKDTKKEQEGKEEDNEVTN